MSAGWVAVTVRSRALARRRLGRVAARELAAEPDLDAALSRLVRSPYGREVRPGMTLAEAERAVVEAALWNVRVLTGWLPRQGVPLLRVLAGPVEAANVVDRLDHLHRGGGAPPPTPYRLGALGTTGLRHSTAATPQEVRLALSRSPWGDPGGVSTREVSLALRLTACARVAAVVPSARDWAAGAAALVAAREIAVGRVPLPARARDELAAVLGARVVAATSVADLVTALPGSAAWALDGVTGPEGLWLAEARWWLRVERDALRLSRRPTPGPEAAVGVAAVLAADAWRVRAALECAARHGRALEELDGVA